MKSHKQNKRRGQNTKKAARKRALIKELKREAERMGLPAHVVTDEYIKSKGSRLQNTHILRANSGGRLQGQRVKQKTGRG
jgi:hypothetical protein